MSAGRGVPVFDHNLLPRLLPVEPVQPFNRDLLPLLAVRRQHVAHVQLAAHLAAVLDLGDGVAGQDRGVSQVELVEFGEPGNRTAGVADDILDRLLAALGIEVPERDSAWVLMVGSMSRNTCQAAADGRWQGCLVVRSWGDLPMDKTAHAGRSCGETRRPANVARQSRKTSGTWPGEGVIRSEMPDLRTADG